MCPSINYSVVMHDSVFHNKNIHEKQSDLMFFYMSQYRHFLHEKLVMFVFWI
jgi:hypothetical protein